MFTVTFIAATKPEYVFIEFAVATSVELHQVMDEFDAKGVIAVGWCKDTANCAKCQERMLGPIENYV